MDSADALAGVAFLEGRWTGVGRIGDVPATGIVECTRPLAGFLQVYVETLRADREPRRECSIWTPLSSGGLAVLALQPDGDVQRWTARPCADGYDLTREEAGATRFEWTLRRRGGDRFDESFHVGPREPGAPQLVEFSYARAEAEPA